MGCMGESHHVSLYVGLIHSEQVGKSELERDMGGKSPCICILDLDILY